MQPSTPPSTAPSPAATSDGGTHAPGTATMKAIVMHEFGGPEVLTVQEVPRPEPGPGEVRVAVEATFIATTKDVSTRTGRHPYSREMTLPHILGGEHAGVVDAVGDGVDPALAGARVGVSAHLPCGTCDRCRAGHDEACPQVAILGIHTDGAYAEHAVVPAANVHRLPEDVSFAQAAAMAANGGVGTGQLDAAGVGAGDWVAVLGATGALGSVDVGLAARRGAHVIALVRDVRAGHALVALGAEAVLDVTSPTLADDLRAVTGGAGVDVVVDNVAVADVFAAYMPALAIGGRVVLSGALSFDPLPVDPRALYVNSITIMGVRTGNRSRIAHFWEIVRDGYRLPPELVATVPFEEIATAHEARSSGRGGHVVLLRP